MNTQNKILSPLVIIFTMMTYHLVSGQISFSEKSEVIRIEKKMMRVAEKMTLDTNQEVRQKSVYQFITLLKDALKINNSFHYRFDSINVMCKAYPEDSSFRILTFQLVLQNQNVRHYGCIQLRKPGAKVIPLLDMSDTFALTPQITLTNRNWYGALYYQIITRKVNNKNIYFLFGYDQNDVFSRKKIIEPMWLEGDTIARMGMPVFVKSNTKSNTSTSTKNSPNTKEVYYRYVLEYSARANATLRYEDDRKLIVHDHVEAPNPKYNDMAFTRVPDGSYEGLKWENNQWVWVEYIPIGEKETNKPIENNNVNLRKKLTFFEEE